MTKISVNDFVTAYLEQQQSSNGIWLNREEITDLYHSLAGVDNQITDGELQLLENDDNGVTIERVPDRQETVEEKIYYDSHIGKTVLAVIEQLAIPLQRYDRSYNINTSNDFDVEVIEEQLNEEPVAYVPQERAQILYEQAYSVIASSGDRHAMVASLFLEEAHRLDPSNINIAMLRYKVDGTTSTTLSSSELSIYNDALHAFLQDHFFEALIRLQPLLENPRLHRHEAMLDLMRRISLNVGDMSMLLERYSVPNDVIQWVKP